MYSYLLIVVTSLFIFTSSFNYIEAQERKNTMTEEIHPEYLYKIVSMEQWQESLMQNRIVLSTSDDKFIHLAKEDQVEEVVRKYWSDKNHMILKLSVEKLIGLLIYEANPGRSTKYYHLYDGSIPLEAVEDVTVILMPV
jgi:uncharacterized protein (DUF952 family)